MTAKDIKDKSKHCKKLMDNVYDIIQSSTVNFGHLKGYQEIGNNVQEIRNELAILNAMLNNWIA